ncbi:MAG: ribosomal protein L7/L12 [Chloroflexi bacterium]|nr:ribosomal protein L7/L12 [Chloroflexota bacterium]MBI5962372.1 ribosomal protein L7/L12 [Chloroflexota bacterium]
MSTFEQEEIALLRLRIVRLEAQVDFLYKHLDVIFTENAHEADDPQIIDALNRDNLIEAIKRYREITGLGLAEAKSAVEKIKKRRGI